MTLLIGFFTVVLILVSLFMMMIILMQRPRSDSGLGAALGGGGAADAAFGAETGNILSKGTIYSAVFFFVASFLLYLGHMYVTHRGDGSYRSLPELQSLAETAPGADADGSLGVPDTSLDSIAEEDVEMVIPAPVEPAAESAPEAPAAGEETAPVEESSGENGV